MKIFAFDFVAYPEHLEHLKLNGELPFPLLKQHFRPELAVRNYEDHLQAWELMDELGYDGIGFNEHHGSPYGLMNSPNVMAAAASQRTKRLKLLIYGNLLPIHQPIRLAEEISMLDCLSNGRVISGFARGIPREHFVYGVDLAESRARFEEAWEIIKLAWTEESFSYEGRFWSYKNVAIWPRPLQQPHPPVWVPVTGSPETIEWAGKHNIPITPGALATIDARKDMIEYYAACLAQNGYQITPEHINVGVSVYVADSREQAIKEVGPYMLYFRHTLFSHGNMANRALQQDLGYLREKALSFVKPEHRDDYVRVLQGFRSATLEDIVRDERPAWGSPEQVRDHLIELAEALGAATLVVHLNQGAMPQEMFIQNLKRFAAEVLPAVQAHQVKKVPVA